MASDYGDEAGEKLFDWMLRIGQEAGENAITASAERLTNAIRNIRGQIDEAPAEETEQVREYARLNMSEFEELPFYQNLREIIDERLTDAAIEHDFTQIDGHDHLVFRIENAPEVDEMFRQLEEDVEQTAQRAREAHEHELNEERDSEPLEQKAEAAREASKAAHDAKEATREVERFEVKTR